MTPERWGQLEELYRAALALPPSERSAMLALADRELGAEVASILAQEENGAFLDRPAWEGRQSLLKHSGPLEGDGHRLCAAAGDPGVVDYQDVRTANRILDAHPPRVNAPGVDLLRRDSQPYERQRKA